MIPADVRETEMGRKRLWRGLEEESAAKQETQTLSDDEEDANADLSMAILDKASRRSPNLLSGVIVLSDDDHSNAPISASPPPSELPGLIYPSPSVPVLTSEQPLTGKTQKSRNKKQKKKKKRKASEIEAEQNQFKKAEESTLIKIIADDEEDNLEMRQLSRGPRYFDPPDILCSHCGNAGHFATDCTDTVRKRACFVCGALDHEVKDCPQSSCLICHEVGHFSKSCPNKSIHYNRIRERGNFCLRCGNIGHDMSTCDREYDPEDLQGIQCYVCKQYGHLCCVDVALTSERPDTCYNCGDVGHTGVGCAKSRGHLDDNRRSGNVCFRCGEEGHYARGCSKRDEDDLWDDFGTSLLELQPSSNDFQGFRSVPAVAKNRRGWHNSDGYKRHVNTPPVRWVERWNMEEGERWSMGGLENEQHRFRGPKFLGETDDYGSPNNWERQSSKWHNKNNKACGQKEVGKSCNSGGHSRRFWKRRWQKH